MYVSSLDGAHITHKIQYVKNPLAPGYNMKEGELEAMFPCQGASSGRLIEGSLALNPGYYLSV